MVFRTFFKEVILWIVTTFLFLLFLFIPRDAKYETGQGGSLVSAEYSYSLQKHIENFKQFFKFIVENKGLGEYMNGISMIEHIGTTFLQSMLLVIPALFLGFFLGIGKGIFDYRTRFRKGRLIGKGSTWLFLSVPDLFFIIFLQISLMLLHEKGLLFHIDLYGNDQIDNYVMGAIFLAIYPIVYIANITFMSLRDEEGMDYIRTALAKGTSSFKVLYRHVLKNCWIKILSHSNTLILYLLSNLFIVEKLMDFKGASMGFISAISSGSSFAVGQSFSIGLFAAAGFIILFTLVIFTVNLISKMCKAYLSPFEREGM